MKKRETKRREVIRSGSQTCEPIELTDLVVVQKHGSEIVLRDTKLNKKELWFESNPTGYCVLIGKKKYEFARSL